MSLSSTLPQSTKTRRVHKPCSPVKFSQVRLENRAYFSELGYHNAGDSLPKPNRTVIVACKCGEIEYLAPATFDGKAFRRLENSTLIQGVSSWAYLNERMLNGQMKSQ